MSEPKPRHPAYAHLTEEEYAAEVERQTAAFNAALALKKEILVRGREIGEEREAKRLGLMPPGERRKIRAELEADGSVWLATLIPAHFRGGATAFAPHHREGIEWGWSIKRDTAPSPPAAIWPWSRGHLKSTLAEAIAVSCGARNTRRLILYVCRTQGQADTHVRNIESMLLHTKIGELYPGLSKPKVKTVGDRHRAGSWTHDLLITDAGFSVAGYGLMGNQRGIRVEQYRPDLIIGDDIDEAGDSPGMVDSLLEALAATVIGTQSMDAAILLAQNPIHRGSVVQRILNRETDVLSDRIVIGGGAVPAVRNAKYERRHEHWYITSGEPTWEQGMPLPVAEQILNKYGKDKWDRECQHDVTKAYVDAIYSMWSETHHIITWSEFAKFFGSMAFDEQKRPRLPGRGHIGFCLDWGNNPNHPCANRWVWQPGENMPLTDSAFFYREMCWPRYPVVEADDRSQPSAVKVGRAIIEAEKEFNESIERPRKRKEDLPELISRVQFRLVSHERPEVGIALRDDLPMAGLPMLLFEGVDTAQAREGILHMQNFLALIDDESHPFRKYPAGHPQAGEPLMGRPRVYFIVDDKQGQLSWDAVQQRLLVAPAIDERGMARTRFEYPNYRKPNTAEGAERRDPLKRDDDIIDTDRAIAGRLFQGIQPLTMEERVELQLRVLGYDHPPLDPASEIVFNMSRDMRRQGLLREELANNQPVYGIGHKIDFKSDPYALIRYQLEKAEQDLELLPDDIFGGGGV